MINIIDVYTKACQVIAIRKAKGLINLMIFN